MRNAIIAIAVALTAVPAFAADAPAVRPGVMLRDANKVRLGSVNAVGPDGSVSLIYNSRYVTVPGSSISTEDGKLVTKLTKAQVDAL